MLLKVINNSKQTLHSTESQMEELSKKIKGLLEERGLSISDLAAQLEVSEYGLRKMINRGTFKSDIMIRIAKIFDVDLSFFGRLHKVNTDNIQPGSGDDLEKQVAALQQVIATKDEVIRAKDDLIETLREKLNKQ